MAIPGVSATTVDDNGVRITSLTVDDEHGSKAIGKMIGNYVTLEVPGLRKQDTDLQNRVTTHFAKQFELFLKRIGLGENAKALVVGLGNWNVTPDALGPIVVENVMITRHFFELMPNDVAPGYRPVSAVSPGVLGITGIESSDIIKGIVQQSQPDFIVAIDALASKAIESQYDDSDFRYRHSSGLRNWQQAARYYRRNYGRPCHCSRCSNCHVCLDDCK